MFIFFCGFNSKQCLIVIAVTNKQIVTSMICQKATKSLWHCKESCLSQILVAGKSHKDEVVDRINKLQVTDKFSYHMTNSCHKIHTYLGRLKQIKRANAVATSTNEID